MTPARRHIHTSKSPDGLLQRNPEIHSRVQIAAVHAHEHDPAEHSIIQIPGVHATEHSPEEHSHCQMSAVEVKCFTRDNGIGLGLTTRCESHSFLGPRNGNDDDDDGCVRNRFRSDSTTTPTTTWT